MDTNHTTREIMLKNAEIITDAREQDDLPLNTVEAS
jgi:hypothetical protein